MTASETPGVPVGTVRRYGRIMYASDGAGWTRMRDATPLDMYEWPDHLPGGDQLLNRLYDKAKAAVEGALAHPSYENLRAANTALDQLGTAHGLAPQSPAGATAEPAGVVTPAKSVTAAGGGAGPAACTDERCWCHTPPKLVAGRAAAGRCGACGWTLGLVALLGGKCTRCGHRLVHGGLKNPGAVGISTPGGMCTCTPEFCRASCRACELHRNVTGRGCIARLTGFRGTAVLRADDAGLPRNQRKLAVSPPDAKRAVQPETRECCPTCDSTDRDVRNTHNGGCDFSEGECTDRWHLAGPRSLAYTRAVAYVALVIAVVTLGFALAAMGIALSTLEGIQP